MHEPTRTISIFCPSNFARAFLVLITASIAQFPILWSTAYLAGYKNPSAQSLLAARVAITFALSILICAIASGKKASVARLFVKALATSAFALLVSIAIGILSPTNWTRPFLNGFATATSERVSPNALTQFRDRASALIADNELILPAKALPREVVNLRQREKPIALLTQDQKEISLIWTSGMLAFGIRVGPHPPEAYSRICGKIN